jgi:hypothetical protein
MFKVITILAITLASTTAAAANEAGLDGDKNSTRSVEGSTSIPEGQNMGQDGEGS